jgi:hypothetical protein
MTKFRGSLCLWNAFRQGPHWHAQRSDVSILRLGFCRGRASAPPKRRRRATDMKTMDIKSIENERDCEHALRRVESVWKSPEGSAKATNWSPRHAESKSMSATSTLAFCCFQT